MSRTYRCKVKQDLTLSVSARDEVEYKLRVNDTLGEQETNDILGAKLRERGGEAVAPDKVRLVIGGVTVDVDLKERTAKAHVGRDTEVKKSFEGVVTAGSWRDRQSEAQASAERKVQTELREQAEQERDEIVREVKKRLGDAADEISKTLREVAAETERDSIVRRAERMGRVLSVNESRDQASGDRRIEIELELPE